MHKLLAFTGVRHANLSRGFTLIELMTSLAIMSIIGLILSSVVMMHTQTYYERLADIDTDQAAQTIISLLQVSAQRAGFGFGHGAGAMGVPAVGLCGPDTPPWPYNPGTNACAHRDNDGANDRLRISYIDPWLLYFGHSEVGSAGPCKGSSGQNPAEIRIPDDAGVGYSATNPSFRGGNGFNMFIGGQCKTSSGPAVFGTSAITLLNDANPGDNCRERRTFKTVPPDSSQALVCPDGFAPGWTMGLGENLDFFTVKDDATGTMQLKVTQQSWGPNVWLVAQGVTRFEVRYALDLSDVPDGKIGRCPSCSEDPYQGTLGATYAWCRDLRPPQDGGDCTVLNAANQPIVAPELYNRIVALHVTFDLTRSVRPGGALGFVAPTGGKKTVTYQTLVVLKNMRAS